ncbi:hypothetical protein ACTD5D_18350 [Nocardia takedensis]|uniref:hypothetical protein n=1 Tax=Nocardia takedensis TaxID=259390 RepID=UPI003F76CACF
MERATSGRLALEEAGWLREAGFPAVWVPREFGGDGASLRQLYLLIVELAAAESNLPHALRVHLRFVEDRWRERHTERGREWLRSTTGRASDSAPARAAPPSSPMSRSSGRGRCFRRRAAPRAIWPTSS